MIENDEQLQQATEALNDLYRALASYRSKILPVNPRNYGIIAQGPLDESVDPTAQALDLDDLDLDPDATG